MSSSVDPLVWGAVKSLHPRTLNRVQLHWCIDWQIWSPKYYQATVSITSQMSLMRHLQTGRHCSKMQHIQQTFFSLPNWWKNSMILILLLPSISKWVQWRNILLHNCHIHGILESAYVQHWKKLIWLFHAKISCTRIVQWILEWSSFLGWQQVETQPSYIQQSLQWDTVLKTVTLEWMLLWRIKYYQDRREYFSFCID